MQAKGKTLLKVVGILFIIGGILNALLSILAFTRLGAVVSDRELFIGMTVFTLVLAAVQLLAGICGIRNCENIGAAKLCLTYGIILIIMGCAYITLNLVLSQVGARALTQLILGLLLPILYTIGAIQNKKSI